MLARPNSLLSLCSLLLAALFVSCVGCQSGPAWLPLGGPVTDQVPGVTPPTERSAEIRRLGEQASGEDQAGKGRIARQLAEAIRDEDDSMIRAAIVEAIGACDGPETERVLEAALQDRAADVRITACEVLGRRGGEESVRLLSEALGSDMNQDVRLAAARALGETGGPGATSALASALDDRDPAMQYRAVQSLESVTGRDFGNDVTRWQQYVRGELPESEQAPSVAERIGNWF
jgi:hypothetical protein